MPDFRHLFPRFALGAIFLVLIAAAIRMPIGQQPIPETAERDGRGETFTIQRLSMGTLFNVTIAAPKEKSKLAAQALAEGMESLAELEGRISSWQPGSETSRVNAAAGIESVAVGPELAQLLTHSLDWTEKTGGAFDVTGGPLFERWELAREQGVLPDRSEVDSLRSLTGSQSVLIENGRVHLQKPGMKLGFGGIGKGFAADRVAAALEAKGFTNFLIDAGGDLLVRGRCGDRSWRVAVRHPRQNGFLASLNAADYAIATSGDYERYFVAGGKRYSHILDLRTGWPATCLTAVTVIARSATDADALATALFVMDPSEGALLVESLPEVEAILVGEDENLILSSGLQLQGDQLTLNWE